MLVNDGGIGGIFLLIWPQRPWLGYGLLLLLGLGAGYALFYYRRDLLKGSGRDKLALLALLFLSFIVNLFPLTLTLNDQLSPPGTTETPQVALLLLGSLPMILAAATIGPGAALLIGFSTGLGRAFWHTQQLYDPFYFAFAGLLIAWCLGQNYMGRTYAWLRHPAIGAALVWASVALAMVFGKYASVGNPNSFLITLDWAISDTFVRALPLIAEGLVSGGVASLLLLTFRRRPPPPLTLQPSPQQRSLRIRLLTQFTIFSALFGLVLVGVVFKITTDVATDLVLTQMAHNAEAVTSQIPDFRSNIQVLLDQYNDSPPLLGNDPEAINDLLAQLFRSSAYFRRIILVGEQGEIKAFYPNQNGEVVVLTNQEQDSAADALQRGASAIVSAQTDEEYVFSVIVPLLDNDGVPAGAIIGRVPGLALDGLVRGLSDEANNGRGFVVNEHNLIIAHTAVESQQTIWSPPAANERQLSFTTSKTLSGIAYEGRDSTSNARELVYTLVSPNHPWTVVVIVPYEVVLDLGLQISLPLAAVLGVALLTFAISLAYLGRTITVPLAGLAAASERIGGGSLDEPVTIQRHDEIGRLARVFEQMRQAMKKQFDEFSLLLNVNQAVVSSIDIGRGVPAVLQGMVRGLQADGARAVIMNPSGRVPMAFSEGPRGEGMTALDRELTVLARNKAEIVLETPGQIRKALSLRPEQPLPIKSLVVIALLAQERFQGLIWLGFNETHHFTPSELNLLRSLAWQASVLVDNARLYATAEGGRRRLAAVLASTSDAVIVTDQTERVLLINPAMERAFQLRPNEVVGRPVSSVIQNHKLAQILTGEGERTRGIEITAVDARTLYANSSLILNNDNQVLGRVAVLHDVTKFKEVDELKSQFVQTVSHDLRGPLTFMNGYLTMLNMVGELNQEQRDYVHKITAGIQQMTTLIEDLLGLGRLEAGVELVRTEVDIKRMLKHVSDEQHEPAKANGLSLNVQIPPRLPMIRADESLLRRAISNLAGNAIKYAPNSGLLTIKAVQDSDEIIFSVQDQGPGIASKDLVNLFKPFVRLRTPGTDRVKGSGLGLSIVKSIAERHGGRVWCESQVGKGSTFYFTVRLNGQPPAG